MSNCNGVYGGMRGDLRYDPNAEKLQADALAGWSGLPVDDRNIGQRIEEKIKECHQRIDELIAIRSRLISGDGLLFRPYELRKLLDSLERR